MSFWMHAFCAQQTNCTPQDLRDAIAAQLRRFTSLLCPEREENPATVISRLRVEPLDSATTPGPIAIRYAARADSFIRVDFYDHGAAVEVIQEVLPTLNDPSVPEIETHLSQAVEDVTFCLKANDVRGMGFPIVMAAAAHLVRQAGGIIQSGHYSWWLPEGKDVRLVLEAPR
jgi:hypothetical protein